MVDGGRLGDDDGPFVRPAVQSGAVEHSPIIRYFVRGVVNEKSCVESLHNERPRMI